jgi:beta-lactamase regulating signal transducer with metallopeptidase domain
MRTIAKNIAGYSIWSMKLLAIIILFAASSYAQTFESRTVNLVSGTPPDLDAYQALTSRAMNGPCAMARA